MNVRPNRSDRRSRCSESADSDARTPLFACCHGCIERTNEILNKPQKPYMIWFGDILFCNVAGFPK
jgi:hypothetical protein